MSVRVFIAVLTLMFSIVLSLAQLGEPAADAFAALTLIVGPILFAIYIATIAAR